MGTYQSPQSAMFKTSCWAPKNFGISQLEEGYAALGVPHVLISMESVAVVMLAGMLARYRTASDGFRGRY